jgi:uncharacterized DUF497 family protein
MTVLRFEWDEAKNRSNQRKHGVSFEEASQIFRDPLHVSVPDRIDDTEQRWRTFGLVGDIALLVVAHAVREEGDTEVVRIISARRATRSEKRRYENQND